MSLNMSILGSVMFSRRVLLKSVFCKLHYVGRLPQEGSGLRGLKAEPAWKPDANRVVEEVELAPDLETESIPSSLKRSQ